MNRFPDDTAGAAGGDDAVRSDTRDEVLRRLERLARLQRGWDGFDGEPVDVSLILAARKLVSALPGALLGEPAVSPTTEGRLQMAWHDGPRSLELEFDARTILHFRRCDFDAGVEEEDIIPPTDTLRVISLLRWFHSGGREE
jgi:hypothetical protein